MKEGTVSLRLIKCLCQGPPRVGKTHIKHLLLEKVLVDSSSTSFAVHPERAFRNIRTEKYKADKSKKTWEVMDYNKLMQLIANEMSQLKVEKRKIDGNNKTDYVIITKIGTLEASTQEVIAKFKSLMPDNVSTHPATSNQEWIYFIDSGGQPQFQEVLQAFIPKTSVILLVFKLIEKLSDAPLMVYQKSGIDYNLGPYALSNQEILIRLARMIHSSSESSMQVALLGTYHDEYVKANPPSETMEEKELHLQEMFSFRRNDLIFYDSMCKNVIFPLNGLQAEEGKFEDPVVCMLRTSITSTPYAIQVEVPIRWHAFELAIQAEAKRNNTQVLSLEKCIELAAALGFPPDDVETALSYLSDYNLIVYYCYLLPNVVFTTPQVLLDKVTELIEHVYLLSNTENRPYATRGEYKTMNNLGIISTQILKDFPEHYVPGLFTEADLVKIFEHLYILTRLEDGTFFMPALLPPITPIELDQLLNPSTPPLLYHFQDSCAPAGLFCALIVCLSSQPISWKVRHDIKPLMGTKSNAVCFHIPGLRLVITLADVFNRFEIHYRSAEGYEMYLPKIREVVSEGLEEVVHNRKFSIKLPKKAFFCRACIDTPSTRRHIATPVLEEKELICSIDPINGCKMNDIESKWLESLPLPPSESDSPTMDQLMTKLIEVSSKWELVGIQLLVPDWKLGIIKRENRGQCKECLMKVLEYWRKHAGTKNPFSWETIINVLQSRPIGNIRLAEDIEQKYTSVKKQLVS